MTPLAISVVGFAVVQHRAERAVIHVSIHDHGISHADVNNNVIGTAKKVQMLLKKMSPTDDPEAAKHTAVLTRWSMTDLKTSSNAGYGSDPKMTYQVSVTFNIRVRDFEKLGTLARRLAEAPLVTISKIAWALTTLTASSSDSRLRKMAAANALQRATDFAEALGLNSVFAISISQEMDYGESGFSNNWEVSGERTRNRMTMQTDHDIDSGTNSATDSGEESDRYLFFEPEYIRQILSVKCEFKARYVHATFSCNVSCVALTTFPDSQRSRR